MNEKALERLFWTKVALWFLVGVAVGVRVHWGVSGSGSPGGAKLISWVPLLGPAALLVFLLIASLEIRKGSSAPAARWGLFALVIAAAALSGRPFFTVLAGWAKPTGLMALVGALVLAAVQLAKNPEDERGRPVGIGTLFGALANKPGSVWCKGAIAAFLVGWMGGAGLGELSAAQLAAAKPGVQAEPARSVVALRVEGAGVGGHALLALPGDLPEGAKASEAVLLLVDGDRGAKAVLFDHKAHVQRLSRDLTEAESCTVCHHMNLPPGKATSCAACHNRTKGTSNPFSHSSHVAKLGGNNSCTQCHEGEDAVAEGVVTKDCGACHRAKQLPKAPLTWPERGIDAPVPSYADAMHGLCVRCHARVEATERVEQAALTLCTNCHRYKAAVPRPKELKQYTKDDLVLPPGWVALPPSGL